MPQSSVYVHQIRPIYIGQLCVERLLRIDYYVYKFKIECNYYLQCTCKGILKMRNDATVKICLYNTVICFKLDRETISLSLKGMRKTSHRKEKQCSFAIIVIYTPIDSKIEKSKATI